MPRRRTAAYAAGCGYRFRVESVLYDLWRLTVISDLYSSTGRVGKNNASYAGRILSTQGKTYDRGVAGNKIQPQIHCA